MPPEPLLSAWPPLSSEDASRGAGRVKRFHRLIRGTSQTPLRRLLGIVQCPFPDAQPCKLGSPQAHCMECLPYRPSLTLLWCMNWRGNLQPAVCFETLRTRAHLDFGVGRTLLRPGVLSHEVEAHFLAFVGGMTTISCARRLGDIRGQAFAVEDNRPHAFCRACAKQGFALLRADESAPRPERGGVMRVAPIA